jgi:hypothetical protein
MNTEKLSNEAVTPPLCNGVVIPRFYYRITNAFKIGLWALKNPDSLKESNFKMLSDLFGLIMEVATEDRHIMTHIAYVLPEEGEKQIVSIWAGAGMGADPTKRIAELLKENSMLRAKLSKYVAPQNVA